MKDSKSMITDLGIGVQFIKGETIAVRNCWHFSTDGNAVGTMFYDAADFKDAMNRIAVVTALYNVVILAFVLMDTHVHFVLYGEFDECNRFMHDFIKRTSMSISFRHGERKTMLNLPISHQKIDDLHYLKTVIC